MLQEQKRVFYPWIRGINEKNLIASARFLLNKIGIYSNQNSQKERDRNQLELIEYGALRLLLTKIKTDICILIS